MLNKEDDKEICSGQALRQTTVHDESSVERNDRKERVCGPGGDGWMEEVGCCVTW